MPTAAPASDLRREPGTPQLPWRLEDIDLAAVDCACARADDTLFFLLASSSFVEAASELYTRNLSQYYADDAEALTWLGSHWEHEELQHGRALRAYIRVVWPEFDWDRANTAFFGEYGARCTLQEFEPSQALELAARCVVETGTATFYRMLHDYTEEPVLKTITRHIKSDEVRHYSHFLSFFERYRNRENTARWPILRAIVRRVVEAGDDDALIAYRHTFAVRYPDRVFDPRDYDQFRRRVRRMMRTHYPVDMALKMLLRPLDLPARLERVLLPVLTRTAGLVLV